MIRNNLSKDEIIKQYGIEWYILMTLCLVGEEFDLEESFVDILGKHEIDWGKLIELAIVHKMLTTLAVHLVRHLYDDTSPLPKKIIHPQVGGFLNMIWRNNIMLTNIHKDLTIEIVKEFQERQINLVATKGFTLESTIHYGDGRRRLSQDIDFLIHADDHFKAVEALKKLEFKSGFFDRGKRKLVPHSRKEELLFKLNPSHIIPMIKFTANPVWEYITADFSSSFTWPNDDIRFDMQEVFRSNRILEASNSAIPILSVAYEFIFTTLHLFKEAWFERYIEYGQDVNLMKFFDIIQLFDRNAAYFCGEEFKNLLIKHHILDKILWVLEHTDRAFKTNFVTRMGMENHLSEDFLHSAYKTTGVIKYWKGSMIERLYAKDALACFN